MVRCVGIENTNPDETSVLMLEKEHSGPVIRLILLELASGACGDLRNVFAWVHCQIERILYSSV